MVAEVCSAYVMRAGEVIELFATEGLRPEAVHRTRLRVGEGLVGVIAATARPLALADAQSHPDFAYRPETGEEIYHSLMGVPILHEPKVVIRQVVAEDVEAEHERLRLAVEAMQDAIDRLVDASRRLGPGEHRDIIETYRMFAADRGWLERITEAVRSGLTAEAAVQKVSDETKSRMMQVTDPYLRERLYDLEDLGNRLH